MMSPEEFEEAIKRHNELLSEENFKEEEREKKSKEMKKRSSSSSSSLVPKSRSAISLEHSKLYDLIAERARYKPKG